MKFCIVLGTRPEIIKLSAIIRILNKNKKDFFIIDTGQHYSKNLKNNFFVELKLPLPDYNLKIFGGTREEQLSKMVPEIKKILLKRNPNCIIVQGDTNSALAGARASKDLGIKIAHVEAGIRSFDLTMPEELNRIEIDKISDFCFAPTKTAKNNLLMEKINKKNIFVVGNTIVEAVLSSLDLLKINKNPKKYVVLTTHRAENVDDYKKLKNLKKILENINEKIIFPIHPRTLKNLKKFKLYNDLKKIENLDIIEPIGFLEFLKLCFEAKIILSDSGGIQEECSIYKKPIVILRENTERPEIIGKFGWIAGYDPKNVLEKYKKININYEKIMNRLKNEPSPFGDGKASERIIKAIEKFKG